VLLERAISSFLNHDPFKHYQTIQESIRSHVKECKKLELRFSGENVDFTYHCSYYEGKCRKALLKYIETNEENIVDIRLMDILCSKDYYGNPCPLAGYYKTMDEIFYEQSLTTSEETYKKYQEEIAKFNNEEIIYANMTCDSTKSCLDDAINLIGHAYPFLNTTECISRLNTTEVNIEVDGSIRAFSFNFLISLITLVLCLILI